MESNILVPENSNANRNTLVIQSHYRNCGNVSPPRITYHVANGINVEAKPTPCRLPIRASQFVTNELKISGLWYLQYRRIVNILPSTAGGSARQSLNERWGDIDIANLESPSSKHATPFQVS